MLKKSCGLCKVVGLLVIIGALNWGFVGLFQTNVVENILGHTTLTRIVYDLVGLSGLIMLASYFVNCPSCKK